MIINNIIIADIASGILTIWDFLSSLESPGNTFVLACGCVYLIQIMMKILYSKKSNSDISFKVKMNS